MKKIKNLLQIFILISFIIGSYISIFYAKDILSKTYSLELLSDGTLIDENDLSSLEDSGITGENLEFDETFYPYFGLLNQNEKMIYKQIYANAENIKTAFVPVIKIPSSEVAETIEAVYNDHPELFWLNTSYSYKYTQDGNCVQIILDYNTIANDLNSGNSLFLDNANKIINEANKLSTNYAKEKYVHDTIISLVNYDENAKINQTAYSALVNHKSVCAGYARAFQYIMIQLGIPTFYVTGTAEGDHAWNIVKLSDGYYNVDLTWDDQSKIIYDYFNVSDSIFNKTHTRNKLSKSLPICNGKNYSNLENNASVSSNNSNYSNENFNNNQNIQQSIEENIQSEFPENNNSNIITFDNDIDNDNEEVEIEKEEE